jgi:hypothetical protein
MHHDRVAAALADFMPRHPHGRAPDRPPPRATPEGRLLRKILEALRQEPDVLVWRNTTGVTEHDGRWVTYGLALGSSDLIGLLGPHGRFVALEVKTPADRVTAHQARFLARAAAGRDRRSGALSRRRPDDDRAGPQGDTAWASRRT